jgi:long-chain fatty acid transport protein
MLSRLLKCLVLSLFILVLGPPAARAQIGPIFAGAGPVNRSMGGAAVAAPLDATGAVFWNAATTAALPTSSADFGVELLYPSSTLSSSLPANSFGPGIPPLPLEGSNRGDDGIFPLPSFALVYKPDDSPLTFGLGLFAIAGFGVNYPASNTNPLLGPVNPILTPQPPNGFGLGSIYSELTVAQITPTVAVKLSDRLAIGVAPALDLASLRADPLFVASPNSNGAFPSGTHTRIAWGGGVQGGVYYTLDGGWQLGASLKSPQWFEDFHFQSTDQLGRPRNIHFSADLPMIASLGVGYSGLERWLFAADFRYIDFEDTAGFRRSGFDRTGAVTGLGFRNVFAASLGAQYQVTDAASLRIGYTYNQDPITNAQSIFNVASATIIEHTLSLGASYKVTDTLSLSANYLHAFQNRIQGPLVTALGEVPGSSIKSTVSADSFTIGVTVMFGGKRCGAERANSP